MDQRRPYRSFVSYIDRSREYYATQGYSRRRRRQAELKT